VTEPGKKPPTIWHELVQRRVVRVALYYGAVAWLLVQVADVVLEAFAADAALKYIIAASAVGFPIALVLSWMFDITPAGIVRAPSRRTDPAVPRSIAVLPFTNLSGDADNDYFSDGLAEEIRDRIAQVPGVRVAARSSSFAFKGKVVDARDVGRQLDVGLLLEGGVRKFRDTLRISAQLVDTRRGYQVWSHSYDRRLEDVFAVQSEIARAILDAVHIRMLDSGSAEARTENFEAYNLYLLGRYHFHKRTEASLKRAIGYFREAIEGDPGYAQAYSGLADATCLLGTGFYGNLSAEESLAEALPAARRALELAPQGAEAHASLGLILQLQRHLTKKDYLKKLTRWPVTMRMRSHIRPG
jgi:adenylate cyclase